MDIERLREINRSSRRRRLAGWAVAAVALIVVGSYLWPRTKQLETEVGWPEDAWGRQLEINFEAPMGGYMVIVPDASTRVLQQDNGLLQIRCDIGRDGDIPLQILVEESEVRGHWELTLADLVDRWMTGKPAADEVWVFDEPLLASMFLGGRGGVPFSFVRYTRRDGRGGEWVGSARLFRSGARFSVVRTETLLEARSRMSNMLSRYFLRMSDHFVDASWEPVMNVRGGSASERLRDARRLGVERDAPAHWPDVDLAFRQALTLAAKNNDVATLNDAVRELLNFREKQQHFYNKLYLGFQDAVQLGDRDKALRIKQMGEAAFALPHDARFQQVRNNWRLP